MFYSRIRFLPLLLVFLYTPVASALQTSGPAFSTCIAFINQNPCDSTLTSIHLGPATVGGGSFAEVDISNPGSSPLVINYSFSAPAFAFGLAQTLPPNPLTVQPGATTRSFIVFLPTSTGFQQAQFVSNDNAPGSPHVIPLSGTGVNVAPNDFAVMLDPNGPSSYTLTAGSTTKFPVYVLEGGGLPLDAGGGIQCSGGPPGSTCTLDQSIFPAFVSQEKFIVSVTVPARSSSLPILPFWWGSVIATCVLALLWRRGRQAVAIPFSVILFASSIVSCGGSSSSSSPPVIISAGVNGSAPHTVTVPVTVN